MSKNKGFSDTSANRYSLALYELARDSNSLVNVEINSRAFLNLISNKINGQILGPVSAPIFKLKNKYRVRLLIRGTKTLKLQNSLASIIPKYKFASGIKLSVDVDPISFN